MAVVEKAVAWVHCGSHGAVHSIRRDGTCWCGCVGKAPDFGLDVTPLKAPKAAVAGRCALSATRAAVSECRSKGLWLCIDKPREGNGLSTSGVLL